MTGFIAGVLQMFASRLSQPMLRLVRLWQQFQQTNLTVHRIGDIMSMVLMANTTGADGLQLR